MSEQWKECTIEEASKAKNGTSQAKSEITGWSDVEFRDGFAWWRNGDKVPTRLGRKWRIPVGPPKPRFVECEIDPSTNTYCAPHGNSPLSIMSTYVYKADKKCNGFAGWKFPDGTTWCDSNIHYRNGVLVANSLKPGAFEFGWTVERAVAVLVEV